MRLFFYTFIVLFVISCGNKNQHKSVLQGDAFGTTYTIQVFSKENINLEKGIDSVIYTVNKSVSTYQPNSDISKINRGDSTIVVDAIFKEVYLISETVYNNSQGFFDPTIGVLRNAYGFGDVKPLKEIDSLTLDSLMQYVGFRKVRINADGTISKKYSEIYFDFNAIAKGYGIDCIGNYLEANGISNYLIELGGEILTQGINLDKNKSWVVGIENIDSQLEDRSYSTTVTLQNEAMAASGNYRKFRVDSLTGKKYVHTLNPLTGSAVKSDVTSATVIAPTCALADAYATAFMAMGLENAKNTLLELDRIEAYLTYNDVNNKPQVFITDGFKRSLN